MIAMPCKIGMLLAFFLLADKGVHLKTRKEVICTKQKCQRGENNKN
jgi:hypothetical protein